ncbi:unnamed protein product [Citrullus colocynthis]|uniref:Lipoxygenase domain-containing protein n=1 Tax=Citrullus colocynthis TaxID=252529 RepID=A0ABP0Y150_9ROSI
MEKACSWRFRAVPLPRHCRTGRPACEKDPSSKQRCHDSKFYVPRDEQFSEVKEQMFQPINPGKKNSLGNVPFSDLPQIEAILRDLKTILQFDQPAFQSDTLSDIFQDVPPPEPPRGLPFMSKLDKNKYGDAESQFNTKLVGTLIGASITIEEAIEKKKLLVLDYHDILMPYVKKDIVILGTLMSLGIELTWLPMYSGDKQWREVFTPSIKGTNLWLWRLAKAHVLSHDSCVHQVVIHWQLSMIAPNLYAIASSFSIQYAHKCKPRESLVNVGGIIESTFSTASLSMELSSLVYKEEWRFDQQALPDDLIR